jgi:AraC-like DNA-binding protein
MKPCPAAPRPEPPTRLRPALPRQNARSLRRQLSEDGQSFRDLLAEARYAKARDLLRQTDLPVEEIAAQIGYAESAAFIHAFRRWAGQSPRAYRQGH